MKKIIIFILTLQALNSFSQVRLADLKKEDIISDFDLEVNILKKQHPNPFKFIQEKKFNDKVDSLRKILVANPDMYHFISCSPVNLIKDIHTSYSSSDDLGTEVGKSLAFFPYPVFIQRGKIFTNNINKEIPFGSEIIDINNVPVKQLLNELAPNVDGNIKTASERNPYYFPYSYTLKNQSIKEHTISFIRPGETGINKITTHAIPLSELHYKISKSVLPINLLEQSSSIYTQLNDEKKIGILTVNSFSLSESHAYKQFSQFFKDVNTKKYTDIIIDIRHNSGGDPAIAALLYSFISKSPFSNVYTYKTKNIKISYPEYVVDGNKRKLSSEEIRANDDFMYQRFDKDSISGMFTGNARLMEGLITNFPKDKDAFSGKINVLISAETISAATYFASLVRMNKRGTIIGKETGSGLDATTAAWFINYELPATKTTLTIPLTEIYFFNATEDRGRGLMPDKELPLELFMKYVHEMKDPEMTYAMEDIK